MLKDMCDWCPLMGGGVAVGVDAIDCRVSNGFTDDCEKWIPLMEDAVVLREKDGVGYGGGAAWRVEAMQPERRLGSACR